MVTDRRLRRDLLRMLEQLRDPDYPRFITRYAIEDTVFNAPQPKYVRRKITEALRDLNLSEEGKIFHYVPWTAPSGPNRVYIKAEKEGGN